MKKYVSKINTPYCKYVLPFAPLRLMYCKKNKKKDKVFKLDEW